MTFSGKDSEIYDTAVSFWREYMKQLENRHAKTAGDMYSNFHATMRHISGYEDIASESNAGYERCLKKREFQACTSSPFTGTSTISGNL